MHSFLDGMYNEWIHKKILTSCFFLLPSLLFFYFSFLPPSLRLLNANKIHCVRANAFQDLQNLSLLSLYDNKIQTLAKGTFTSLRAIQTLWVKHTHTHWNTHTLLYTLWHMLIRYHKTWANTGVVYLQVCVITQEWNHEVERWVNLSSSQTPRHTHTQLLQLDRDQKQHIYPTQSFHHCYGDNTNSLKLMSPFFCPKQQGNTNTAINTDTRRASKIYSIRFSHCHRNTCWGW